MVTKKGTIESEKYNESPVIPGNKKVWFLNGDLVRIHHYNHSNGIMSVYNINKDQIESTFSSLSKEWGGIDFIVHGIAMSGIKG